MIKQIKKKKKKATVPDIEELHFGISASWSFPQTLVLMFC